MTREISIELDPETLLPRTEDLIWLSFADGDRPKGEQFLGACIVPGHDVISGVMHAWRLKCNPGGEAVAQLIPREMRAIIGEKWIGRLLSRAECAEFDREIAEQAPRKPA